MTMTIDSNQQRFPLTNFDHMSPYSNHHQPQFTNPWASSPVTATQGGSHSMYVGSSHGGLNSNSLSLDGMKLHHQPQQQQQQLLPQPVPRTGAGVGASMASYSSIPVTAASAGSTLASDSVYTGQQDLLSVPQDLLSLARLPHQTTSGAPYAETAYVTTAAPPIHSTYTTSPTHYDQLGYAPAPMRSTFAMPQDAAPDARRYSQPSVLTPPLVDPELLPPRQARRSWQASASPEEGNMLVDFTYNRGLPQNDDRRTFADAIEASHGILSLSQETPRPLYGSRTRGSGDSGYGFPSTHSTSSSVSSSAGFSGYYNGSVDSSVSDYSTAGSDIESVSSRTLPRPQGMPASSQVPPAPQSMMSQFSSKVSSSTQKKHKCRVCDKRFTRPSSLQTHMYSHTGEKPFTCEVDGCGRHFSVVSNLRRHRKVHKDKAPSEAGSEDHQSD